MVIVQSAIATQAIMSSDEEHASHVSYQQSPRYSPRSPNYSPRSSPRYSYYSLRSSLRSPYYSPRSSPRYSYYSPRSEGSMEDHFEEERHHDSDDFRQDHSDNENGSSGDESDTRRDTEEETANHSHQASRDERLENDGSNQGMEGNGSNIDHSDDENGRSEHESDTRRNTEEETANHSQASRDDRLVNDGSNITDDILEMLTCPVCLALPRPDGEHIKGCRNGHFVCRNCIAQVNSCPVCREADLDCRNLLAEKLMSGDWIQNHLFKCKFCPKKEPLKCLETHESVCPFRIVKCPTTACNWTGPLAQFYKHGSDCGMVFVGNDYSEDDNRPEECTEIVTLIELPYIDLFSKQETIIVLVHPNLFNIGCYIKAHPLNTKQVGKIFLASICSLLPSEIAFKSRVEIKTEGSFLRFEGTLSMKGRLQGSEGNQTFFSAGHLKSVEVGFMRYDYFYKSNKSINDDFSGKEELLKEALSICTKDNEERGERRRIAWAKARECKRRRTTS